MYLSKESEDCWGSKERYWSTTEWKASALVAVGGENLIRILINFLGQYSEAPYLFAGIWREVETFLAALLTYPTSLILEIWIQITLPGT